ncbi:eukaryotic translation initiation factor 4G [Tripterygium wilfordii]|uniref:Eukaryotic translation initiation factor 4G n=1 Tax=Tripterygium wilfordii TaxID=458696 RepID=A0A7J7CCI8_TRIWF|nr:eukaryotic translation initiation factor 4G-like [Tripterygium wilfordii]KAF5731587.1 eukaryotic translation initiation factor 4G [Tripterygium wilfordii]
MSVNQSRSDRGDTQYRKSGRSASSNQQRSSSGVYGKGGGGGGPAPSPSISSSSSTLPSGRSFKKGNNAQGGQYRGNVPAVNSSESSNATTAPRNVQNGAHIQPQVHGTSNVQVSSGTPAKPTGVSGTQTSSNRAVPKVPTSQPSTLTSGGGGPATPVKAPGDATKAFPFQFGSINPGFMNGMQIPARTSSAPPNLDEQKRDQARHEPIRSGHPLPTPVPKQQAPRKGNGIDQPNSVEVQPVSKAKRDSQESAAPSVSQTQKPPVLPIPMTSLQIPFHQTQVSVQFGGPNPQIQSQGVTGTSLQMPIPMPLSMGNGPQVQQQVFIQGLQHQMQPQGIMHHGQGLGFTTQMGPQLSPNLGSLGIGMTPQYPQQQGGNFGGPRKTTVKITHPETHEELRLDKRVDEYADSSTSAQRSHPNVPQSQPVPTYGPSHPINYYPGTYNPNPLFFPAPSSLPLKSSQIAPNSQAPRPNYSVNQGPQNMSFMNQSATSLPINKTGVAVHGSAVPSNSEHTCDVPTVITTLPLGTTKVTVKPATGSSGEKMAESSLHNNPPAIKNSGSPKSSRPSGEVSSSYSRRDAEACSESPLQQPKPAGESYASKPVAAAQIGVVTSFVSVDNAVTNHLSSTSDGQFEEFVPDVTNTEGRKKEILRSNSINDHQKRLEKNRHLQPHHQVGEQHSSTSLPSLDSDSDEAKGIGAFGTNVGGGLASISSEVSNDGSIVHTLDTTNNAKSDDYSLQEQLDRETLGAQENIGKAMLEESKEDSDGSNLSSVSGTSESPLVAKQADQGYVFKETGISNECPNSQTVQRGLDEPVNCCKKADDTSDNIETLTSRTDSTDFENYSGDNIAVLDASTNKSDLMDRSEISIMKTVMQDQQPDADTSTDLSEATSKDSVESTSSGMASLSISSSKDKPIPELTRPKSGNAKAKKKRKELLQKADAAGTTSDLYMAYKGPEEKKESAVSSEVTDSVTLKQESADFHGGDDAVSEKGVQNKAEPDDWEDAADISALKLESPANREKAHGGLLNYEKDGNENTDKKYSKDFLLQFADKCTNLPEDFEIASDIAETLMNTNVNVSHPIDSYPSPGRVIDRHSGSSRVDRRGSVMVDDDRWNKQLGPFGGRDLRLDIGYGSNAGSRPGEGGNYGVLRNPRAQVPLQYGGILSGPIQSMGSQGGMHRSSPDADRWQRATNFQHKGLFPSLQTPLQAMHKAERKYEVGKVTDEEQAKQRQLKAILNKLTPQNFEKLFEQVKAVNIDNVVTLTGVISQIFDKALMEPTFCEMYADFCHHLAGEMPDFSEDNEKITFRRLLLNKCQEEFERGEREQEEANKGDEEGDVKLSLEEREEKRVKARRRMLGNIRLIGELYKKRMLTERIMHECIKKLLGQYQNPDEEDVEALCKLMSTIGEMIDHPRAKEHMDAYFDRMENLSTNMKISSRVRFMLKDSIDLRKRKWQQRRKVEGPKKIEEVHRDAAQERQAQTSRLARAPSMNPSRRAPMDFGPRGSNMIPSPNAQMGGFRALPSQARGFAAQDVRMDDRKSYEARTLSVPLPQRPIDDSLTLGPQGGLARGMSIRGAPTISSMPVANISTSSGDSRSMAAGLNGYNSVSERTTYSPREDLLPRYAPDRYTVPAAFDQSSGLDRNMSSNHNIRNQGHSFERSIATSPPPRGQPSAFTQNIPSEKVWPEERLRDMSIAAIKEFYSARDEKEVALCITDMNSPSFHPSMVALWVTDSFERKDVERDLLAKLLVNLTKPRDAALSQGQLMKGLESVLSTLEDAVNDAPKAPEFLGRLFARVILDSLIPLREIGRLLLDGGEEPGRLKEVGLAGDVLGSTLEMIKSEKGESALNAIVASSNLQLENFRPPDPNISRRLETFI